MGATDSQDDMGPRTFPAPFSMAFQPIVDLNARSVFAYEALVRGPRGETAWSVLRSVTEENGHAFDQGCRKAAIALSGALDLAKGPALLSINFLPSAVRDPEGCMRPTLELARRVGLSPQRLVFEFPEGERLDRDRLFRIIATYKALGVRTAIDDFGAGYSGLTLLAKFQPDIVKLDMELVRDIDCEPVKRALVRGVVGVCREIGVEVVAEGIETMGEHQALLDLGVALQQGYLFARPGFEILPAVSWPSPRLIAAA